MMYSKLCTKTWIALNNLKDDQRGIAALEYAILAAIVLVAVVAAFEGLDLGGENGIFGKMRDALTDANAL